ncbi:MAG TPA: App1 family protein [Thermoanaerobaculia bacterium]
MANITGITASRRRSLRSGLAAIFCLCLLGACSAPPIDDDEHVILFPTFAVEDDSSSWTGDVRGWIYEPETGRAREEMARVLETLIAQRFKLPRELQRKAAASGSPFAQRADMFLVDNERVKRLSVTIAGQTVAMGQSEKNGHFEGEVKLPAAAGRPGDWIDVRALTGSGDTRVFAGRVQLIPRTGISVISDIDDTIKHSQVRDKVQLGLNTFFRDFRATSGMAALYKRWESGGGVTFHYVSGSPFQLYPDLVDFARKDGFPEGSFHLRKFRLKDRSVAEFFGDPMVFKLRTIRPILDQFRDRRFILVGDSGEKDPEIYAQLASEFPNVAAILIRDVTNEDLEAPRYDGLFSNLPERIERRVFRDPRDLDDFKPR